MDVPGVGDGERASGEHDVRLDKRQAGEGFCDSLPVRDEVPERRQDYVLEE